MPKKQSLIKRRFRWFFPSIFSTSVWLYAIASSKAWSSFPSQSMAASHIWNQSMTKSQTHHIKWKISAFHMKSTGKRTDRLIKRLEKIKLYTLLGRTIDHLATGWWKKKESITYWVIVEVVTDNTNTKFVVAARRQSFLEFISHLWTYAGHSHVVTLSIRWRNTTMLQRETREFSWCNTTMLQTETRDISTFEIKHTGMYAQTDTCTCICIHNWKTTNSPIEKDNWVRKRTFLLQSV